MNEPDITIRISRSEFVLELHCRKPPNFTLRHEHNGSSINIEQIGRLVASVFKGNIVYYDRPKQAGDAQVLTGRFDATALVYSGTAYNITYTDGAITVDRAGMFCKDDDKQYRFCIPEDSRHLTPLFLELIRYHHPVSTLQEIAAANERSRVLAQRIAEDVKDIFAKARS